MALYLRQQVAAGAQAVQVFDSWAGSLAEREYAELVVPALARLLAALDDLDVPRILYLGGGAHLVGAVASLPLEVLSVDWRTELTRAAAATAGAVQGNLDPAVLLSHPSAVSRATRRMIAAAPPTGYIANLGHGILPHTPLAAVTAFLDAVRGGQ
jgi:uroporphyrinogen decarboxylase